jgi:translation elongation factor EF-1alpha
MEKLIGKITHYFNKINVGIVELTDGELKVGDTIHVKGHTSDFTQQVISMQVEHEQIEKAKKGDAIGIKVDAHVHEHDEVFLVTE